MLHKRESNTYTQKNPPQTNFRQIFNLINKSINLIPPISLYPFQGDEDLCTRQITPFLILYSWTLFAFQYIYVYI